MTTNQPGRLATKVLIWTAVAFFVLAMPCAGLGVLGLLGIAADVSSAENRDIGFGFLKIALVPAGLGVATLLMLLAVRPPKDPGD
jgi:hypothetical protein